mgnify:CR=1 FL=1
MPTIVPFDAVPSALHEQLLDAAFGAITENFKERFGATLPAPPEQRGYRCHVPEPC